MSRYSKGTARPRPNVSKYDIGGEQSSRNEEDQNKNQEAQAAGTGAYLYFSSRFPISSSQHKLHNSNRVIRILTQNGIARMRLKQPTSTSMVPALPSPLSEYHRRPASRAGLLAWQFEVNQFVGRHQAEPNQMEQRYCVTLQGISLSNWIVRSMPLGKK